MEWLKHSKRTPAKCDICNTEYQFKTIYDPQMPSRIPAVLVRAKIASIIKKSFMMSSSVLLAVVCIIVQVPLYWTFTVRVLTWVIDGKLPDTNPNFWDALKFGDNKVDLAMVAQAAGDSAFRRFYYEAALVMYLGYFRGLGQIICCIIAVLAFYLQHEWVIRDDGFAMMLLRKIGQEPRSKLVDMIQQAIRGLRNDAPNSDDARENLERIENLVRVLNDLQNQGTRNSRERQEALRRAIENGIPDDFNQNGANALGAMSLGRDFQTNVNDTHYNDAYDGDNDELTTPIDIDSDRMRIARDSSRSSYEFDDEYSGLENEDEDEQEQQLQQIPNAFRDIPQDAASELESEILSESEPDLADEPFPHLQLPVGNNPIEFDVGEGNINDDAARHDEGPEEDAGLDIFEFFGMGLNIKTPVLLMFFLDSMFAMILFAIYLIPHILGNFILMLVRFATVYLDPRVFFMEQSFFTHDGWVIETKNPFYDFVFFLIHECFYKHIVSTYLRLFVDQYPPNLSWLDRSIVLGLGYFCIGYSIHILMKNLVLVPKPIMGTPRTIYKVLFEIVATVKVLYVFSVEFFFSPAYCGWLLDFCFTPLFEYHIREIKDVYLDGVPAKAIKYNLFSTFQNLASSFGTYIMPLFIGKSPGPWLNWIAAVQTSNYFSPFWRIFLYWLFGTVYAVILAVFVGMTRSKILRPGVLFFIRSPEDPNTRLIHSALVKPLNIQMSRVLYRGRVYSIFILVGIGTVSWAITQLIIPSLFPLSWGPIWFYAPVLYCYCLQYRSLLKQYHFKYWKYAFDVACHKMRLSHFILGKPIPQERGDIFYRNAYYLLIEQPYPDYSNPISYNQVQKAFDENPELRAVFVPNGNYVRVPDNDTTARKFIKRQFIAVTKDDKILHPEELDRIDAEEAAKAIKRQDSDYVTTDSDGDGGILRPNHYTVVYQPPNFKKRWMGLIGLLWVFALILILGLMGLALLAGNTGRYLCDVIVLIATGSSSRIPLWKIIFTDRIDLFSLCAGLAFVSHGLLTLLVTLTERSNNENAGFNEVIIDDADVLLDDAEPPANVEPVAAGNNQNEVEGHFGVIEQLCAGIMALMLGYIRLQWALLFFTSCNISYRALKGYPYESLIPSDHRTPGIVLLLLLIVTLLSFLLKGAKMIYKEENRGIVFHKLLRLWLRHFVWAIMDCGMLLVLPIPILKQFALTDEPRWLILLSVIGGLQMAFRALLAGWLIWQRLSEEVKNERYVQGRAIENMDVGDDE